jgi:pyruvate/2-oxoglutarate dehydrogenase complex dihydrolipoamide dehydrogenase (E3) component
VDCKAKERQQIKGDEMTLGDFMDVLGRLHKLTPAQRRAVAEVLAEVPEATQKKRQLVAKTAKLNPPLSRVEYTTQDQSDFAFAAQMWKHWSKETRENQVAGMSRHMHRTEKAIRYQITSRLK